MMKSRLLPFGFAALGLFLFGLALWRANLPTPDNTESTALALIEPSFGSLTLEREGERQPLTRRHSLRRFDTLETGADSEAVLAFLGGEEVRLLENTLAVIDSQEGHPVLLLKGGDIWVENIPENSRMIVSREGLRKTLKEISAEKVQTLKPVSVSRKNSKEDLPAKALREENAPARRTRLENLTAEYIQQTLRTQRNLFFRCYAQLLQKSPGSHGDAALSFTIERTGKVSLAEVASSSLGDPSFKKCLTETIRRVEFKSFAGDPVNALFPVKFE